MKRKGQSPEPPSYRRKYSYSKTRFLDSHIKTREIWEENENTFVPLIAEHMISGEDIALFMQDTLDCILDKLAYRYTATRIHTLARKIRRADNGRIFEAKNFEAIYKALYLTLEQKERIKKAF